VQREIARVGSLAETASRRRCGNLLPLRPVIGVNADEFARSEVEPLHQRTSDAAEILDLTTAIKLTGETVQILNDRGYSYLLRGDLGKARAKFLKVYQLDPTNPTVINNIQLLNSSYRFVERIP